MPQMLIHPEALELAALLEPTWDATLLQLQGAHIPLALESGGGGAGGGGGEGAAAGGGEAEGGGETPAPGAESEGLGLYDFSETPEEIVPYLQQELRKIEGNVTKRFTEAKEFQDRMGPLAEIEGLADIPPENLSALVQVNEMLSDPESAVELARSILSEVGESEVDAETWTQQGIDNGWLDGEEGEEGEDGPDIEARIAEILDERLGPVQDFIGNQQQTQEVQQVAQEYGDRLEAVQQENDVQLSPEDQASVLELAHAYLGEDDPIGAAFSKFQSIRGGAEGDALQGKLDNQMGASLSGGQVDTSPEKLSFGDSRLKDAALARMRG